MIKNNFLQKKGKIYYRSLIVLLLAVPTVSHSQITVSYSNIVSLDTVIYRATDNYPDSSIQPGGTGLVTWDFSSLVNRELDSLEFVNPALTPFAADFPNSNICMKNKEGYTYFNKSASKLAVDGMAADFLENGTLVPAKADPGFTYLKIPANYTDNFVEATPISGVVDAETVDVSGFDSIFLSGNINVELYVDAYGTLITPLDTMNVLRQKVIHTINYIITAKKYLAGEVLYTKELANSSETLYEYRWWTDTPHVGYPVVEMEVNSSGSVLSVDFVTKFGIDISSPVSTNCYDSCDATATLNGSQAQLTYQWYDPDSQTTSAATGLCVGNYSVRVSDSTGAYSLMPFTVENNVQLSGSVMAFGATCIDCADGALRAKGSGGNPPYSYQWDSAAGYAMLNIANNLSVGYYTVTISDSTGCTATITSYLDLFYGVIVFPNPAKDQITFLTRAYEEKKLSLYDYSGRKAKEITFYDTNFTLYTHDLSEGVYIYKIEGAGGEVLNVDRVAVLGQ